MQCMLSVCKSVLRSQLTVSDLQWQSLWHFMTKTCREHFNSSSHGLSLLQQHYAEEPVSDYVQAAVTTAVAFHDQELPGDILIFLTGQQECESAVSMLEEEARRYRRAQAGSLRLMPVALYAGLPAADQLQAFQPAPRGYRKVSRRCTCRGKICVVRCELKGVPE